VHGWNVPPVFSRVVIETIYGIRLFVKTTDADTGDVKRFSFEGIEDKQI
jgi:hypothetical protein